VDDTYRPGFGAVNFPRRLDFLTFTASVATVAVGAVFAEDFFFGSFSDIF
jgi:hypothetical protein